VTKVKICGITRLEDARCALDQGAALLGFNFYERSPRYLEPTAARTIVDALGGRVNTDAGAGTVGVFVNQPTPGEVIRLAKIAGVSMAQLHGDESDAFAAEVARFLPVIRVLRIGEGFDAAAIAEKSFDWLLLDSASPQFGGSGRSFDWNAAVALRGQTRHLLVAGGLNASNAGAAIARLQPEFVDLCSGIESQPGIKSCEKIRHLMAAVAAAQGCGNEKVQGV
jgi:phosphoribosylanthranilate isomerase